MYSYYGIFQLLPPLSLPEMYYKQSLCCSRFVPNVFYIHIFLYRRVFWRHIPVLLREELLLISHPRNYIYFICVSESLTIWLYCSSVNCINDRGPLGAGTISWFQRYSKFNRFVILLTNMNFNIFKLYLCPLQNFFDSSVENTLLFWHILSNSSCVWMFLITSSTIATVVITLPSFILMGHDRKKESPFSVWAVNFGYTLSKNTVIYPITLLNQKRSCRFSSLQLLFIISAYHYKSFSDWIYASPQQSCQKDLLKTPAISKIKISFIVILRFLSTKRPQRCNLDTLRSWFINQTHVKKKTASLRFARDAVCFLTFLICDSISIIMKIWETLRYFWNYHYNRRLSSW